MSSLTIEMQELITRCEYVMNYNNEFEIFFNKKISELSEANQLNNVPKFVRIEQLLPKEDLVENETINLFEEKLKHNESILDLNIYNYTQLMKLV